MAEWLAGPFNRVVCRDSHEEFAKAEQIPHHVVITDSSLDGAEVALTFKPRDSWPPWFRFLPLYR